MNKKANKARLILVLLILLLIFIETAIVTAAKVRDIRSRKGLGGPEAVTELYVYDMNEHCRKNTAEVFKLLASGNSKRLSKLMTDPGGLDSVTEFADWSSADFDNAVSMGTGSLSEGPDADGKMDVSERVFVDAGGTKYVFYIETLTSGNGKKNEGVSAIAVTTYDHFDDMDYEWNGEPDDQSALAGTLFRDK